MTKLPVFKTERLILRDINENDALDMFEYSWAEETTAALEMQMFNKRGDF